MEESVSKQLNSYIRKYSKNELMDMCKTHGLDRGGKKHDLALRLVSWERKVPQESLFSDSREGSQKIALVPPVVRIEKDENGHMIHWDTGLIFHEESRRVIGVRESNGVVRDLQVDDIDLCKKYKFPFEMPLRLNDQITIYEMLENSDYEHEEQESLTTDGDEDELESMVEEDEDM